MGASHTQNLGELRTLVRGIVLAQGNIFIRELLRSKKLRIGTTKAEFEENLLAAIDSGALSLTDVHDWLEQVEGWGDQHIYLYDVDQDLLKQRQWYSPDDLKAKLKPELRRLWQSGTSLEFPEKRTLTGIYYEGESLRFEWHERVGGWVRTPDRDYQKTIDGDLYEFRAYRERLDRTVMRFVLRVDLAVAGIFLQTEWNEAAHKAAIADVQKSVEQVVSIDRLQPFSTSDIIKNLDQMELGAQKVPIRAQRMRLSDANTYVEFASTSELHAYKESAMIRRIRRAATPSMDDFGGSVGAFLFETATPTGLARTVKVDVYGEQRRVRVRAQLKASEVWEIIAALKRAKQFKMKAKGSS